MVINVGINGFGRVGRVVFRTCLDHPDIKITAINDPAIDVEYICYLMKYDSTHGTLKFKITRDGNKIFIDDCQIQVFLEKVPQNVPWHTAEVHYVVEASGMFTNIEKASGHLIHKGVKRVIVTAPSIDVPMLILGVNEADIKADMKIVSCGSSTLYCLAPIAKVLEDNFGIEEGFITSIHAMTPSLKPLDGLCLKGKHWRDHRSITQNIIPATIGACKALGRVIPSLQGKTCGLAFRVPITNVSVLDFTVRLQCSTSLQSIASSVEHFFKLTKQTIMKVNTEDVVSSDFIGDRYSCILDLGSSIQLNPDSFKLICWYENEYSYACRVLDLIIFSEAQFKQDIKNRFNILSPQTMRETAQQKHVKPRSPIPRYANKPLIVQQPAKANTINHLERSSPSINVRINRNSCRSMSPCKIFNDVDDPSFIRRQSTFLQTTPKAAVSPTSNTTNNSPRQKSPNPFSRAPSPGPICTASGCRAQERLELVKKEFSKMVDMTENLLKQSYPNSRIDIEASESKIANDKELNSRSSKDISKKGSNNSVSNKCDSNKTDSNKSNSNKSDLNKIDVNSNETLEKNIYFTRSNEPDNEHPEPSCTTGSKSEMNGSYGTETSTRTEHGRSDDSILDATLQTIASSNPICNSVVEVKSEVEPKAQNEKPEAKKYKPFASDFYNEVFRFYGFDREYTKQETKSESYDNKKYEQFRLNHQTVHESSEKDIKLIHTDKKILTDDDLTTGSKKRNESVETVQNYGSKVDECELYNNDKIHDKNMFNFTSETEQIDDKKPAQSSSFTEHDGRYSSDKNINTMKNERRIRILEPEEVGVSRSSSPQSRKQDIYDKLDSASNSTSSISLSTTKKKSQIIAITDLTSSLEDLERLDKICRIMEISDELSDVLFSALNEKPTQDGDERARWSFKELCEKVNLDEFCNKVFGK